MKDDIDRVDGLAGKLQFSELTDTEQTELDALLQRNPEARHRFVSHLVLENDLQEDASLLLNSANRTIPFPFKKTVVFPLGIAAALALGIWVFLQATGFNPIGRTEFAENAARNKILATSVGIVRKAIGVESTDDSVKLHGGGILYPGLLEVATGLAQLDLYSGVSLVVEGPAKLEIINPDQVRLHSGKVRANVPPPARGFRLLTGEFDLVDLGTEFGVSVGPDGTGELHVIDGEVQVKSISASDQAGELLTTGKSVALNRDGSHPAIAADGNQFAGTAALQERSQKRFTIWQDAMGSLANDPDTVALYDFQMGPDNRIPNLAIHGPEDTEGVVVGCTVGQGRWAQKASLDFRNPSQRVRVKIPGNFDALTMATWVKLDSLKQFSQSLIQSEDKESKSCLWYLRHRKPTQGLLPVFADTTSDASGRGDRHPYNSNKLALPFNREGSWMHLAITLDNQAREVVHYANGREIDRQPITEPRPIGIGLADIGNWPSRDWATGTKWEVRNIVGNMDEFLISRRAFSVKEIHKLFRAGRQ